MAAQPTIAFAKFAAVKKGTVFVLSAEEAKLSEGARAHDPAGALTRTLPAADFSGKFGTSTEIFAPEGTALDRLVVLGAGKPSALDEYAWLKLGGHVAASLRKAKEAVVVVDLPGVEADGAEAASLAAGILLRAYSFDKYKTKKSDDAKDDVGTTAKITVQTTNPAAAKKAFAELEAVVDGVIVARDLVNEPANALGPLEFAERAKQLEALGV